MSLDSGIQIDGTPSQTIIYLHFEEKQVRKQKFLIFFPKTGTVFFSWGREGKAELRMVRQGGVRRVQAVHGRRHDPARETRALAAEIQPVHARFVRRAVTVEPNRT